MKMHQKFISIITLTTCLSGMAVAKDCGAPPQEKPNLPAAASITAGELKKVRDGIISFSSEVDVYMTCMDERGKKLLPYLTKEQQTRWEEDLTEVHENRRQIQITLNDLIRAYRKQTASK